MTRKYLWSKLSTFARAGAAAALMLRCTIYSETVLGPRTNDGGLADGASDGPTDGATDGPSGDAAVTVTSVQVTPATSASDPTISLGLYGNLTFDAVAFYSDGSRADVTNSAACTWTSSDVSVAQISADGTLTGIAAGTTLVSAMVGSITSNTVNITIEASSPTGIEITTAVPSLVVGTSSQFRVTATYSGYTADVTTAVSWSASPSTYATVTSGLVTALNPGSTSSTPVTTSIGATLTTQSGTLTANPITLTVLNPITALAINPALVPSLAPGATTTFALNATYASDASAPISASSWTSSSTSTLTIQSSGTATGVAAGSSQVTATFVDSGVSISPAATVVQTGVYGAENLVVTAPGSGPLLITSSTYATTAATLPSTLQFGMQVDNGGNDIQVSAGIAWYSSSTTVATINNGVTPGLAMLLAYGTTTITGCATSGTANCINVALTVSK